MLRKAAIYRFFNELHFMGRSAFNMSGDSKAYGFHDLRYATLVGPEKLIFCQPSGNTLFFDKIEAKEKIGAKSQPPT
jgi:hypothetical protein